MTTRKALDAMGNRPAFGINFDPSHFAHQFLDSGGFVRGVRRPDLPRARQGLEAYLNGRNSILGSHLNFGEPAARLGLRLARPRRRDLRAALPRPQPHRLPGAALDRVGRLGHGPRLGRARRAGLRAPHRLRALDQWRSTRRSRASRGQGLVDRRPTTAGHRSL